ncbi:MAG: hypothetical protein D6753_04425 [Planctomycetota bacterium]|nr:MAG: hypothetical protein D6753_04425 [Planctomycetota bacterium]
MRLGHDHVGLVEGRIDGFAVHHQVFACIHEFGFIPVEFQAARTRVPGTRFLCLLPGSNLGIGARAQNCRDSLRSLGLQILHAITTRCIGEIEDSLQVRTRRSFVHKLPVIGQPGLVDQFADGPAQSCCDFDVPPRIGVATWIPLVIGLFFSPRTTDVGYRPQQPIPFSHKLHAGELKMDCRYCHATVEDSAYAAIPTTTMCMNCHASIRSDSDKLADLRHSFETGQPVRWVKIHDEPDFVFFNHAAHVNHGVGCVTCHGRIDQMEQVHQHEPLSMAWCLKCHRNPTPNLRPLDRITDMEWSADQASDQPADLLQRLHEQYEIPSSQFMTNCTVCHR